VPTIYIKAPGERPIFSTVIAFLWSDKQNVDTDGNAHHPASRTWTDLYVQNRDSIDEVVDVSPYQESPLVLGVESRYLYLAARTAFYLAKTCGGTVACELAGEYGSPDVLLPMMGADFDVALAMQRVAKSSFVYSSLDNPYPNLG
jgi:hypothetical protein